MNAESFFTNLRENTKPVVVEISAKWCVPCRVMRPALERVLAAYREQVDFIEIDADENPDLVRHLRVLGVPTLIAYRKGEEIVRRVGSQSESGLKALFEGVSTGNLPNSAPSTFDRALRLAAGIALLALGWFTARSPLLMAAGALVLFSAVYDRCPVWRALSSRLAQVFRRNSSSEMNRS